MTTNAELAELLTAVAGKFDFMVEDVLAWATGPVDGGPNNDGYYHLRLADGTGFVTAPSPAKLAALKIDVESIVANDSLINAVVDRKFETEADLLASEDDEEGSAHLAEPGDWSMTWNDPDPEKNAFWLKTEADPPWVAKVPIGYTAIENLHAALLSLAANQIALEASIATFIVFPED